jgi:hypothetical protein
MRLAGIWRKLISRFRKFYDVEEVAIHLEESAIIFYTQGPESAESILRDFVSIY